MGARETQATPHYEQNSYYPTSKNIFYVSYLWTRSNKDENALEVIILPKVCESLTEDDMVSSRNYKDFYEILN